MDSRKTSQSLGVAYQIPRNALILLMIAQVVVVLPYLLHLSPWLIAMGLFCGYWRTRVYRGMWDFPGQWVKALLVLASVAGVALSGVSMFSLEAVSSVLILAFALKLIEMKSRRDAYLVIFLSYFVIAIQFLFDQSILIALYELCAIVIVTAALVGLNQLHSGVRPLVSLKLASVLVLQAVPFAVVLFLLFPRISPLWFVPLPSGAATGLSDEVTPGEIAKLTQSDKLAFRVVFDGGIPRYRDLYWRGLVYPEFEAGTWRAGPDLPPLPRERVPAAAEIGYDYEVVLEPTMRNWLFAMDKAFSRATTVRRTRDHRLEVLDPVTTVFRYRVSSYPNESLDPDRLESYIESRAAYVDVTSNPRVVQLGRELRTQTDNPGELAERILSMIRQQEYSYTLDPPRYTGADTVDQFWFEGRAGFCTHYAGAFVLLMRAAGVPARMVGGYQGGEINPLTGHLVVRQYDAHAWAEIWVPQVGWQRVDPTAAVAPERIEQGLHAALSLADLASLSALTAARLSEGLLGSMLQFADSLEHRWNLWVVGYDNNVQSGFLESILGEMTPTRIGLAMAAGGGLSLGILAAVLFWRRRPGPSHPVEKAFVEFSTRLAGYGYRRLPEESPARFVRRVADEVGLSEAQVGELIAELTTLLYNPAVAWGAVELRQLRRQLRRLQFRFAFGAGR